MGNENRNESTSTLMRKLCKTTNLDRFFKANEEAFQMSPFHEFITEKCTEINTAPERVILRAGLDRVYGHQIFQGIRRPSRDKVIQLAFGFDLGPDETQELLRRARYSELYPKIKRDAAILFCIQRKISFIDTQNLLDELQLPIIGGKNNA